MARNAPPTRPRLAVRVAAAALAVGLAAAAPAGAARPGAPAKGTYTGTIAGTGAFVAVVVDGKGRVLAHVSDGRATSAWFRTTARTRAFSLRAGSGERLRVRVAGGRLRGTIVLRGKARPYAATRTRKPAGLYRARRTVGGKRHVGGWIVLPDGRQRGAVRVGARTLPAPLVHPAARGGVTVGAVRLRPGYVGPGSRL